MKWKDSGEMVEKEESTKEDYFDEEQYSPWAERKDIKKNFKLGKIQVLSILLAVAIIALVVALLVLLMNGGGTVDTQRMAELEKRMQNLEDRLDKYETIDEKVTTIWEQAKTFEKFKDRFDRSEASASLRMDHLTMSLEAVQKQLNEAQINSTAGVPGPDGAAKTTSKNQYHLVQAGDTLYSISRKYQLEVEQLLQYNQMNPDSVIVPGQKLIVRKAP